MAYTVDNYGLHDVHEAYVLQTSTVALVYEILAFTPTAQAEILSLKSFFSVSPSSANFLIPS